MKLSLLLFANLCVVASCGSSAAAVLVLQPNGQYANMPDLMTANNAADMAGKKVIVTGTETVPPDFTWRSDARLVVEKGGSIVIAGGPTIAGPFVAGHVKIVTGGTKITKELPTAIGLPPIAWTSRVDTLDGMNLSPTNGFTSQMVTGTDIPAQVPASAWPDGVPDPAKVAGFFVGYNGAHSAAFHTVINPLLLLTPADTGVVTTNGTEVSWVSGAPFRTDWQQGTITINNALYKIASVQNQKHLTLMKPAGTQSEALYMSGGGGNVIEVDLNSSVDAESDPATGRGAAGIIVASGGAAKSGTAIITAASNSPTNAWRNGVVVNNFTNSGIAAVNPAANTANGLSITNGSSGYSEIRGGTPVLALTGSSANLLRITPSTDTPSHVVAYGTNAANTAVNWSITQGGAGSFTTLAVTNLPVFADNAAAQAGGLIINQVYRTPSGALMIVYR